MNTITLDPEATVATETPQLLDALTPESQEFLPMVITLNYFLIRTTASTEIVVSEDYPFEAVETLPADEAASGFDAVWQWARRQDFPQDHAERMRQEAWGRQPE